jgi:hypothetical protein
VKKILPFTATGDAEKPSRCAIPAGPAIASCRLRIERCRDAGHVVHHVQLAVVEHGRGNERGSSRTGPRQVCLRDVPAPARPYGQRWPDTSRCGKHQPVPDHGRRNDFERVALARPELAASDRIVRGDRCLAADDQLVAVRCANDDRRAPPHICGTRRPPQRFARLGIKCSDK